MQPALHTAGGSVLKHFSTVSSSRHACHMGNSIPCWRCLLDGFLQKVRDKCGLDTSFGQANIKHYRKDAWGRCVTGNIEKLWGLPLGNAVSNGSRFIGNDIFLPNLPGVASSDNLIIFEYLWILVYFMEYFVSSSWNQVVGCRHPDGDSAGENAPWMRKFLNFSSRAGTVAACAYRLQQGNHADVPGWTVMVERTAARSKNGNTYMIYGCFQK